MSLAYSSEYSCSNEMTGNHSCDRECHGRHLPGGDTRRKKAAAPGKEPLPEYDQIRNEALGAQDRQAYLASDAIPKRLVK